MDLMFSMRFCLRKTNKQNKKNKETNMEKIIEEDMPTLTSVFPMCFYRLLYVGIYHTLNKREEKGEGRTRKKWK